LTGLIYLDPESKDLHDLMETVDTPLNSLREADLNPGTAALQRINQSFR
jgi:2-oxoglutarate ferredoxin oxidoreductase subunit beta